MQEYKLLRTEDMATFNAKKTHSFDPQVVKANAENILGFIKQTCVKEGGTYWIFKDPESQHIHLYDLTDDAEEEETKES